MPDFAFLDAWPVFKLADWSFHIEAAIKRREKLLAELSLNVDGGALSNERPTTQPSLPFEDKSSEEG
jgi:hypothetical protein